MARYALIIAALASLAVTALSGFFLVPLLRKLKFGQTIKEVGPTWHKDKQGTPTMGGFMFGIGSCVGVLAGYPALAAAATQTDPGGAGLMLLGIFTAGGLWGHWVYGRLPEGGAQAEPWPARPL